MLGLDRPYIASSLKSSDEESDTICLEYGSATQLYLVPFVQHEEQVSQLIILWYLAKHLRSKFVFLVLRYV